MDTSDDKYRRQIEEAWKDLSFWESTLRGVEQRVQDLRELIRANANLLMDDKERGCELFLLDIFKHPSNITEAVKATLFLAGPNGERLTPTDIKRRAEQRGFNFSEYTNPLASIHTILRRMKESNPPEVDFNEADGTYILVGKPADISPEFTKEVKSRIIDRTWKVDQETIDRATIEVIDEAFEEIKKRKRAKEFKG